MEFDYNVNLVFGCHFKEKKFQDGRQITRKLYDWPLRIKTAEDTLPYMFAAYKYNEKP